MEHLFERWSEIRQALESAPRWLLLLDFDGTLSPIAERPEDATLPQVSRERLAALARLPHVDIGIISGRTAQDVRASVGLDGVEYVGNHGRERLGLGAEVAEEDSEAKRRLGAVTEAFHEKLRDIQGIYLESKGLTLAVHFRRTPDLRHAEVRQVAQEVARAFAGSFHITEGKMVFDVVPADAVSKGSTALEMVRKRGGLSRVLPIYCGDDTTDEAAFRDLPRQSVTVCVGGPEKQSAARYRLNDPGEVSTFLDRILSCKTPTEP